LKTVITTATATATATATDHTKKQVDKKSKAILPSQMLRKASKSPRP
jgi:hypothetical protein